LQRRLKLPRHRVYGHQPVNPSLVSAAWRFHLALDATPRSDGRLVAIRHSIKNGAEGAPEVFADTGRQQQVVEPILD
jgi:hypothetical protein